MNLCKLIGPIAGVLALACSNPAHEQATLDSAPESIPPPGNYPPGRWRLSSPGPLYSAMIWASHILIRHRDSGLQAPATFIPWYPAAPPPPRSHDEALALAQKVAKEAGAAPDRFAALARQYSEDVATAP